MSTPEISVLVAAYDVERYLAQCLESILGQTLEALEVVVVDDASTDDSAEIARRYAQRDSRLRLIEHSENRGLGPVRNTGLNHATGRYVMFVDGDDWLRPHALEAIRDRCESAGARIGLFRALDYFEEDDRFAENEYTALRVPPLFRIGPATIGRVSVTTWCKLYERELLMKSGVRFLDGVRHEDTHFHFCFFARTEPRIVTLDEAIYIYRQRSDSIMGEQRLIQEDTPSVYAAIWRFLEAEELTNRYGDIIARRIAFQFEGTLARLDGCAQRPFYEGMRDVVRAIASSPVRPEPLPEPLARVLEKDYVGFLQQRNEQLIATRKDPWYRFGQLPFRARVKWGLRVGLERTGFSWLVSFLRTLRGR